MIKKLFICLLIAGLSTPMHAQTDRRSIEKFATEAINQIMANGQAPSNDILDSLSNNAEVSIEMVSRMDDSDNPKQSSACLQLIDNIVDYSKTDNGRKYTDIIRRGLKKAIDRSYETGVQLHVMKQLARCAKPADAEDIEKYLEITELAPTAKSILEAINSNDKQEQPEIVAEETAAHVAENTTPVVEATAPVVETIVPAASSEAQTKATETIATTPKTIAEAPKAETTEQPEIEEIKSVPATESNENSNEVANDANPYIKYLQLRAEDERTTDKAQHEKLIISLGETKTIQALAYLRKYYGKLDYADALATASTEIIYANPDINAGYYVNGLLYAAKQSYIRHYNEPGVDKRIDKVLAAIDNWSADGSYNFSHTEATQMERNGFWVISDELSNFAMTFDWKTNGALTVSIHSMPVLTLSCEKGANLAGYDEWHKFNCIDDWSTANIRVVDNHVTVYINGTKVIDNLQIKNPEADAPAKESGFVKFTADENGATVRQYCFRKI